MRHHPSSALNTVHIQRHRHHSTHQRYHQYPSTAATSAAIDGSICCGAAADWGCAYAYPMEADAIGACWLAVDQCIKIDLCHRSH